MFAPLTSAFLDLKVKLGSVRLGNKGTVMQVRTKNIFQPWKDTDPPPFHLLVSPGQGG